MTIKEWINSLGGISKAARGLGVAQATVWSWYHLERFPCASNQDLINKTSQNQVAMADWLAAYKAASMAAKESA